MGRELLINSLTNSQGEIPLFSFFNEIKKNGSIREVQAVISPNRRNPRTVVSIARRAFGVVIQLHEVNVNKDFHDQSDNSFAGKFGFKILPVADIALVRKNVRAWIAPALVPLDHPLYHKTEGENSVYVISHKNKNQPLQDGSSYYVRLKVVDSTEALSQVVEKFTNANISIQKMLKPQAKKGSNEADMAFILQPCQEQALQFAMARLEGLKDIVRSANVPLRVLGGTK